MVYYFDLMDAKLKKKAETFFMQFPKQQLAKEELIIEPDGRTNEAYYLKSGYVRTYTISPQGIELTLHIFAPGSYFPMMNVLAGVKNQYYYESLTPVEFYPVSKTEILKFFQQEPEILFDLSKRILTGMDKLLMRIEQLVFTKAQVRVVSALLFLSKHFGLKNGQAVKLKTPFTHKDIAAFAGTTRETASREIQILVKKGVIFYERHLLTIKNIDLLQKRIFM